MPALALLPTAPRRHTSEPTKAPGAWVAAAPRGPAHQLFDQLLATDAAAADAALQQRSRSYLEARLEEAQALPCELPDTPAGLVDWMHASHAKVGALYADYLSERRIGAPRRFFGNRAHALHFLRGVAPTKLADGSWLYGVLRHWRNPLMDNLVRTFVEELGDGDPDKNHVLLYRRLLATHGLDHAPDLSDDHYVQGAIQLSLAAHTEHFLPEVIGFNLGYEQLPLHLLITSYELNELGIDPYYFTLHVTVDNSDSGHARRAIDAVEAALPRGPGANAFWQRVRNGFRLNELGASTTSVVQSFDAEAEVCNILARKSVAGRSAHSDYCRLGGKTINAWLSEPGGIPAFLAALEAAGWIQRGEAPAQSRFWNLLQGPRAEMFGVFDAYELQVIHDWIRGDASADGADIEATAQAARTGTPVRRPRAFRHQLRMAGADAGAPADLARPVAELPDADTIALEDALAALPDRGSRIDALVAQMAPGAHWRPAGLRATRLFVDLALR